MDFKTFLKLNISQKNCFVTKVPHTSAIFGLFKYLVDNLFHPA
ncbi:hypothetical protein NT06LI_0776 [Listeria innocua FSL J1-023]|nr:hypothetical protein NT06LI_0776 [Listeria innocua FSL J1-023]